MMLIDTHLHLIDRKRLTYPWLAGAGVLNRDSLYADYAREARRLGITATFHMEVDVAEADIGRETDYVKEVAQEPGCLIRGAIANCRPENPDFAAYVERIEHDSFVVGLRRCLHVMPDELSEQNVFRLHIRALGQTRLTFDLVMLPRQIHQTLALIDAAPETRFILDHCGVPDIRGHGFAQWAPGLSAIAQRPNVIIKLSGLMAYADPADWTDETMRPYVEHVIEAFGWDRVVWGSDFPVCTLGGSLSTWVALTRALTDGCSADEKAKLFHRNITALWNLDTDGRLAKA
jgi:predicted TIM-barrel fold metal-dependent hydrolase